LIEKAQLKSGDAVLVNGASGGIGTLVVQMAKDIVGESGRVVAICSGRNVELVKGLGADEVSYFYPIGNLVEARRADECRSSIMKLIRQSTGISQGDTKTQNSTALSTPSES
jgi:NADPH:quinone reductase-like Zn-dependent oxidoreductase